MEFIKPNLPRVVTLLPDNKRLKQIIREHGEQWLVLEDRNVQCFSGERGLFIEALHGSHQRWVLPSQVRHLRWAFPSQER